MAFIPLSSRTFVPASEGQSGGTFTAQLELQNPEVLQEWLRLDEDFRKQYQKLFDNFIFEVHKYLIRVTPIDTGQLRGGWTSWLDKNSQDYSKQLHDISIAEKAPGRDYHFDDKAVQEGKTQSSFDAPNPLDITILNAVPYGIYLEVGSSMLSARNFVEITRFKAESHMERVFNQYLDKIAQQGRLVDPDPVEEISA